MDRYFSPLGTSVDVVYRFGCTELFASGALIGYTEDYLILEQHSDQYGSVDCFPVKIPYACILRIQMSDSGSTEPAS
jgi:hypothetical protein